MLQPLRWMLALALALSASFSAFSQTPAKEIPPVPARYFTDQAGIVDPAVGEKINQQLEQFERDTSNQVLVVIYNKLPEDTEIAQFAVDTYHAWKVGQKGKDNGAILFVFAQDRKIQITTGYGLEGSLPDALCSTIIRHEIVPAFKQGDFTGGIQAGVNAIIAATKGEYKGTGTTVADSTQGQDNSLPPGVVIFIILVIIILVFVLPRGGGGPMIFYGGGGGGFSGGDGGSFGGGGDSGGFSGGGGDSGGGGAGGSW